MTKLDIFGDNRKTPKLSINVKVKVDTKNQIETNNWNKFFGYLMKKPRTKLEFISVNTIRKLNLSKIKASMLKEFLSEEDYNQLHRIKDLFNKRLTTDVKAFILALLRIPYENLKNISEKE